MKKVIVLFIASIMLTSCSSEDPMKKGPMVIQEVTKKSSVIKELSPGETWEVPGNFSVTLHSVTRTDKRIEGMQDNYEDLVIVKYKTENLGRDAVLAPQVVLDEKGVTGRKAMLIEDVHGVNTYEIFSELGKPEEIITGYALENKSSEVLVSFIELTEDSSADGDNIVGIYFRCPVED